MLNNSNMLLLLSLYFLLLHSKSCH